MNSSISIRKNPLSGTPAAVFAAALAALMLGAAGGYLAKTVTLSATAPVAHVVAAQSGDSQSVMPRALRGGPQS